MWNGATRAIKTSAAALLAAGAAAGAIGGIAINAGSDFESAFAGVKKTVDGTADQIADLEESLRLMAKNKPQTAVELAGIAEAAGQLGIAVENIEDFTETMADLKEATNLGDEGATQFARFANITQMDPEDYRNLASAIVDLGNNSATTEADIMAMAMRIAGAGHQVGMTEAEILGMSASLSSVGIEAEAGGSAISKLMVDMQLAVEKGSAAWDDLNKAMAESGHNSADAERAVVAGGTALKNLAAATGISAEEIRAQVKEAREFSGQLEDFASVAGMTGDEFAKAFRDDAAGAISKFITGLNDTERNGKSAIAVLDDMDITEIRLRDTLLRSANAGDLFKNSLDLASEAFEENTALTKEAEQRYATLESRFGMVKNRLTDMGITLYQEMRDPLADVMDVALQFTDSSDLFKSDFIREMANNFQASIPTMIRQVDNAKDAFLDFADPFLKVGGWMIDNPDVIVGTLAGIGTTIASLKLAKTIDEVTGSMKALYVALAGNPVTAVIGLAVLAGGAIVGVSAKIKIAKNEMKKQKLDESFGDISLSLGELQDMAKQILGEDTLGAMSLAMEELGKTSDIADKIEDASKAVEKITWKIGMGLELSDADTEALGANIDSMIKDSLDLVQQAQYTAHVNINALFDEGDQTGQLLLHGFDAMYNSINAEVAELGKQLGDAYKNAMEDGIVDVNEAKVIRELQAKLGHVTRQVSDAQLDAKMERIKVQYSGKEMDSDTFQNLQKEIQDELVVAKESANQAFEYDLGALNLRLSRSQSGDAVLGDADYLTQELYNQLKSDLDNQLTKKTMELELKGVDFQTDTIEGAFGEEIKTLTDGMGANLSSILSQNLTDISNGGNAVWEWSLEAISGLLNLDSLDAATKDAIGELWSNMEPDFDNLTTLKKQYMEAGKAVPQAIQDGISEAAKIGILAGDEEAIWEAMGISAANDVGLQETIRTLKESGKYIPDAIVEGMNANTGVITSEVDAIQNQTGEYLNNKFANFDVDSVIRVNFRTDIGPLEKLSKTLYPNVQMHASGGIFDTPHLGMVAEAGIPEAIIPLENTPRSKSIWQEAGEKLGMFASEGEGGRGTSGGGTGGTSGEPISITYAPVYNISGTPSVEDFRQIQIKSYEEFEHNINRWYRDKQRLTF